MGFRISDIFSMYLRHNDVNDYLDYLEQTYPNIVTVTTEGLSYEGRPLKTIRISYKDVTATTRKPLPVVIVPTKKKRSSSSSAMIRPKKRISIKKTSLTDVQLPPQKSVVLIDGGIHAREWISVATALYCIYELTERLQKNKQLLRKLDFVIVPIVNVDGYEYTHTNSRFWRKTRKPVDGCRHIGTDCNRNFDFHWSSACPRASKYTFRGVAPFSEPETTMLKAIMHSLSPHCKFYLSLHAHAKAFMYPWGYTKDLPTNWRDLHALAKVGHQAIKEKTGTHYRCGSVALLIRHTAAGGSPDYAFGAVKIPFAMVMELSGGGFGFDPPVGEIKRLVRESWVGIQAMCNSIANS